MNLNFLQTLGGPTVQRAVLKASKYAPEILTGVGIAGVVGSTILIAHASTKLEPVVSKLEKGREEHQARKIMVQELEEEPGQMVSVYTDKELQQYITKVYGLYALDLIKLYAPGASISIMSIVSILMAHGIMKRRAVALLGAYKVLEQSFAAYRSRVVEEYGIEKDRDFALGFRTEKYKDEETGKTVTRRTFDPNHVSPYARLFDETNENWRGDISEYNLMFLKNTQNWANDRLRVRGFLFLSEVYQDLGFRVTSQSQVVGWVMDPANGGDLHVDFGIYTADAQKARDFVNGLEDSIMLDFNVDGVILDLI